MLGQFLALLKDWQTLEAGGLAIIAALIGGYFIMKQVRLAERQEKDRRARAYAVARATLPLTLSSILNYALACGRTLGALYTLRYSERIDPQSSAPRFPPPPVEIISNFQHLIETTADSAEGDVFADLLGALQVQAARLRSLETNLAPNAPNSVVVVASEIETYILGAADLYARASALFDFARRRSERPPSMFSLEHRKQALHYMGLYDYDQTRLYETAASRPISM